MVQVSTEILDITDYIIYTGNIGDGDERAI